MKKTTYLSVLVLTCVIARIIEAVCLKGEIVGDVLHLSCKVDWLKADIEIYGPDKKLFGSCPGPTKYSKNLEICDKKLNMTQNIITNTTKLVVHQSKSFNFFGEWMCKHGTGLGSDTFVVINAHENKKTDCSCSNKIINTVFWTFMVTIVLVLLFGVMMKLETFSTIQAKLCKIGFFGTRPPPGEEDAPLLDRSTSANECLKCKMLSACALCVDCNCFYCEICCDTHTKANPKHKVCMIEHTIKSRFDVKCKICNHQEPTVVCTSCKQVLCDNCTCEHEADRVNIELIKHKERRERSISCCSSELKRVQKIDIENVQACGMCILNTGQIVIGDRKNMKLLTHKVGKIDDFQLEFEPRGLVHMYEKKIAVTFSHEKRIIIFELKNTTWTDLKTLKFEDKPFSISYNEDHFAVEIGESEYGFIGIVSTEGTIISKIPNKCDFAYFTGNTIRLALDMRRSRVYVSALSKKLVSCVDFDGNIVWHVPIASPRGIIFVPGIALGHKNIVCASKRHNTVYEMASEKDYDVLLSGSQIPGPRYIAYSYQLSKLCIQTDNGQFLVYDYKIL